MEHGTPFLNIELTSLHKKGVLICALPDPRLVWLLHPEYITRYWRTPVEIGPRSHSRLSSSSGSSMRDAAEALSFEQLERRVRSRMPMPTGFSAPPPPPPGSPPPPPPLYGDFHSASLYTRLAAAFGVLFTFDATHAEAFEAARDDVHAVLSMWRHWVVTDIQGESLQGQDLEECRAITAAVARFLQYDPDVGRVEKLLGADVTKKMLETVSGEANLVRPWWMQQ